MGDLRLVQSPSRIEKSYDYPKSFWNDEPPTVHVNLILSRAEQILQSQVESFWRLENCGILPAKDVALSQEDKRALKSMESGTKWTGKKYEVPMLWASPEPKFPNNYPVARKRYSLLEKKFESKPELHEKMNNVIQGYLKSDPPQARVMTTEEAAKTSDTTWYLPIHPVTNPNKPGKIRVVNDAAAEYQGMSLNKQLMTGPDLVNSLVGVLVRF